MTQMILQGTSGPRIGPPHSRDLGSERILFRVSSNVGRLLREIFSGHVPWQVKEENQQEISSEFRCNSRPCPATISPRFRSGVAERQTDRKTAPQAKSGKETPKLQNVLIVVFLAYFCPILRVAVFSYPVWGAKSFPTLGYYGHNSNPVRGEGGYRSM